MLVEIALGVVLVSVLGVLAYYKKTFSYWKRRKIPYITPKFPFGNISNPFIAKQHLFLDVVDVYKELKANGHKYGGFYMMANPFFIVMDPEHIKRVTTKDFNVFVNRSIHYPDSEDPLGNHLVALNDNKWKSLRSKLSPTFTSAKIKLMFKTLQDCSVHLLKEMEKQSKQNQALDIRELLASFMTDVISSCAFGIECNSFQNPNAELRKFGRELLIGESSIKTKLKRMIFSGFPKLAKLVGIRKRNADEINLFLNVTKDTVEHRESNDITRPDFLQLLIQMKNGPERLSLDEIAAQCYIFYLGGFETSSGLLTFCTYELAIHQNIQDDLRREVNKVLDQYNGEVTYEAINEMQYLEEVLLETLRKYPPIPLLHRVCSTNYRLPNTDVIIEKGTNILISNYALQHDPEYFPEPEIFNPKRFSKENKDSLVPYTFLPFGEGPRNCIGLRFGMLQAKMSLVAILKTFKLFPSEKTPKQIRFHACSLTLSSLETLYLYAEKIN